MNADKTSPLVSIQIVTWNRKNDLARCIRSALAQTYTNRELVVIDNNSMDGTDLMVADLFPSVKFIRLKSNVGCPSARNVGFRYCSGKYIYMLDDDGWLDSRAVEIALKRMEAVPNIAVVMSRILEYENGIVVRMRPINCSTPSYQANFSGGCSMIRRDALDAAGVFSDDFFRQAEESDLALRLLESGYYCFLETDSIMYHAPSVYGRDKGAFMYYTLRNTTKTALRLWPQPWCMLRLCLNLYYAIFYMFVFRQPLLPFRLFRELLNDLRGIRTQRHPVSRATFMAYRKLCKTTLQCPLI